MDEESGQIVMCLKDMSVNAIVTQNVEGGPSLDEEKIKELFTNDYETNVRVLVVCHRLFRNVLFREIGQFQYGLQN